MDDDSYTPDMFSEPVARGLRFLVERGHEFDLDQARIPINDEDAPFDMVEFHQCALARAGDTHYYAALDRIHPGLEVTAWDALRWAVDHGFNIATPEGFFAGVPDAAYVALTQEWARQLTEYRATLATTPA